MASRTNRYRRGEKSTDIRVGYLGGKPSIIANWGGRMYGVPLSMDGAGNTTRDSNFGNIRVKGDAVFDSGASVLRVKGDGISIKESNVEVAKFGATTTVKDINLTGKINITSTGSQNVCIGTGNSDVSGSTDNISIGVNAGNALESGSLYNILIGTSAGVLIDTGDANTCIGKDTAPALTTGAANTCIGYLSGSVQDTGAGGLYIGHRATASASNVNNEGVIAVGSINLTTVGRGAQSLVLGHESLVNIYMNRDGSARTFLGYINFLERSSDPAEPAEGHAVVWMSDGTGKGADGDILIASQAGGNTYYNTLFDHDASSGNTW